MIRLRGVIKKASVPLFFLLAFGWSWGCWLSLPKILDTYRDVLQGAESILFVNTIPIYIRIGFAVATLTATFGPAISAVILTAVISGKTGLREFWGRVVNWWVGLRYYLAVFLIPPIMVIVQFALFTLLGGKPQTNIADYSFLAVLGMYADFFFRAGGQEELGFRGFAQPKLQEKFSPVITSLIIGMLWFFWHLPLYLWMPGVPQYGQNLFYGLLAQISFCFTYTWIYNRTQSILLPMLLHAAVNTVQTFLSTSFSHPHPLGWHIAWLSLIIPYAVLGVWLVWRDESKHKTVLSLYHQGYSQ